jgi:hypothetical protein
VIRTPASGGAFSKSCSWCHAVNVVGSIVRGVPIPSPKACGTCKHRADVPRAECDCEQCTRPYVPPVNTPEELLAALELLNAGRLAREKRNAEAKRLMAGYLESSGQNPDPNAGSRNPAEPIPELHVQWCGGCGHKFFGLPNLPLEEAQAKAREMRCRYCIEEERP